MSAKYIKPTNYGHEYTLRLSPETCKLDLLFVQKNLDSTPGSAKNFPAFNFVIRRTGDLTYLLDIDFSNDVLIGADLDLILAYLSATVYVPRKFILVDSYGKLAQAAPTIKNMLLSAAAGSLVISAALGSTAALWSMIGFQQFIGYFIYINVDYPYIVELFLSIFQSMNLSFLPNPISALMKSWSQEFPSLKSDSLEVKYQPPQKFMNYNLTSFFIENGGQTIIISLGFLLITAVSPTVLRLRFIPGRRKLAKLQLQLKWNVNARAFLESGIPMALALFLQLRKATFSTLYNVVSVSFAFIGFVYLATMSMFLVKILHTRDASDLRTKEVKMTYGTLYEGISLRKPHGKYYNMIILLRGTLLVFLAVFLDVSPRAQIIPLIIYNIGLIYYMFKISSFEDFKLDIVNKIKEVFILIGEVSILFLTLEKNSKIYYQTISLIIIGFLGSALVIEVLYSIYIQFGGLKVGFRKMMFLILNFIRKQRRTRREFKYSTTSQKRTRAVMPQLEIGLSKNTSCTNNINSMNTSFMVENSTLALELGAPNKARNLFI